MDVSINSWINSEFSNINFGDKRLTSRFFSIFNSFMENAQSNISSVFEQWSDIKGCYRFFDNKKVSPENVLEPHIASTVERINSSIDNTLIVHDTTFIDYKDREKTIGLDSINQVSKKSRVCKGLILHNSFALSTTGEPLGLVGQQFIDRKQLNPSQSKNKDRHKKPVEEKESYRWIEAIKNINENYDIQNKVIHVADREGDFYEFYRDISEIDELFLIRACHNRAINKEKRREKPKDKIFDYFAQLPREYCFRLQVQINKEKKYRDAKLAVSYSKFTLPPPPDRTKSKDGDNLSNINLYGIIVDEIDPPEDEEPLKWLLVTNMSVENISQAIEMIRWYSLRWNIELYHKVLKSGCAIENAQLRTGDKLKKYITVKSIIAWRIFWMTRAFNLNSEESCSTVLSEQEHTILYRRFNKGKIPNKWSTTGEIYVWIAKLGGYIGRKSDPPPGYISIWRGWTRLMQMVEDFGIIYG